MHRFHCSKVLVYDAVQVSAALFDVADYAPQYALVSVSLYVDLYVKKVAHFGIGKEQDALDDHDMARLYPDDLTGTVMLAVIIYRAVNGLACLQFFQVLDQKVSLKRVRMIVIHLNALIKGNTVLTAVIIVMIYDGDVITEIIFY